MALWTFTPTTPTTVTVFRTGTATVSYTVTSMAARPRTLVVSPIPGVVQATGPGLCAKPFVLAQYQSCPLSLTITGADVPLGGLRGGPGRLDVVFLEGWLLGFQPVPSATDTRLRTPNERLGAYDAWHRQLDVMLDLRMADDAQVVRWRVEAEQAMRASGNPALSDAETEDYLRRFLPAYTTWGRTVARGRWRGDALMSLTPDAERLPVARG